MIYTIGYQSEATVRGGIRVVPVLLSIPNSISSCDIVRSIGLFPLKYQKV